MPDVNLTPEQWDALFPPRPLATVKPEVENPVVATFEHPKLREEQRVIAGIDEPIPIVYGRQQVGGRVFAIDKQVNSPLNTSVWTIGYIVCQGEIQSVETVWINGATAVGGVSVNTYTGNYAAQNGSPDALLSAAISGYSDDLTYGTDQAFAYVVIQYDETHYSDWPEVIVEVKGKKCPNPRNMTGKICVGNHSRKCDLPVAIPLAGASVSFLHYTGSTGSPLDYTILRSTTLARIIGVDMSTGRLDPHGDLSNVELNKENYATTSDTMANGESHRVTFSVSGSSTLTLADIGPMGDGAGIQYLEIKLPDGRRWRYALNEGSGTDAVNEGNTGASYNGTWDSASWATITPSNNSQFNNNPACHLADFDTFEYIYSGNEVTPDPWGVLAAQDYCDDLLGISPEEKRRRSGFTVSNARTRESVAQEMAFMASVFRFRRGLEIVYVPDKPETSIRYITEADVIRDSLVITRKDNTGQPNIYTYSYADDTDNIWQEKYSTEVGSATYQRRVQQVSYSGCRFHSQAYRQAEEQQAKDALNLYATFRTVDDGLDLEAGDVIKIDHDLIVDDLGVTTFRIISPPLQYAPGRWQIDLREYDGTVYSNSVVAAS